MAKLDVVIKAIDLEPVKVLIKTMKKITEDTRISEDIRQEYLKEIEVIMMCEQNTLTAEELEEDAVEETTEESTEDLEDE